MALDDKAKQDMESGLEHAVRVVQACFARLEQNVFIPCMASSRRFASGHPITSTFISIFLMLSFFPVIFFLGFALLVSATFAFIALAVAFLASTVVIVAAGGVLAITLAVLFVVSIFLTISVVSLFITARLGQHLRSEPNLRQGITDWAQETRARLAWHTTRSPRPDVSSTEVKDASGSDEWHAVHNGHS